MASAKTASSRRKPLSKAARPNLRFEAVKIDSLFQILEAVAFLPKPKLAPIAQFAGVDPRTAGKVIKNGLLIGLIMASGDSSYSLARPYPVEGTIGQKRAVVAEALLRMPLIVDIKRFLKMGDALEVAMRKAATVSGEVVFDPSALSPLVSWANSFDVLDLNRSVEKLVDAAVASKEIRHVAKNPVQMAFISHSSLDKAFVRQLASDLVASGIKVWLDEQQIQVGDSVPEKVAQGLAESDVFLFVASANSTKSAWVQKELNGALIREIERREVIVLPLKLDETPLPESIKDKHYADFSESYSEGLKEVRSALTKAGRIE